MRILVTGAQGFVGSAFVRRALARGHVVAGLARCTVSAGDEPAVTWLAGTLAALPWDAIEHFRPETCFHAAWVTEPGTYLEAPANRDHLGWALALAEGLFARGLTHFVGLGTCAEYRSCERPLHETCSPLEPRSLYARCKHELRLTLETCARRHHAAVAWARLFYTYGVGEHPARLCSSIVRGLAADGRVTLRTPESVKDYTHIEDVAEAIVRIVEARHDGTINVGTGSGVRVAEIAGRIARLMGKPHGVVPAAEHAEDPLAHIVADVARLRGLGWRPAIELDAGLAQLVERLTA